jgi:hypothetical protein
MPACSFACQIGISIFPLHFNCLLQFDIAVNACQVDVRDLGLLRGFLPDHANRVRILGNAM